MSAKATGYIELVDGRDRTVTTLRFEGDPQRQLIAAIHRWRHLGVDGGRVYSDAGEILGYA